MSTATNELPPVVEVDASQQDSITAEQVEAFKRAGLLLVRGLLRDPELGLLREQTQKLVDWASASKVDHPDVRYTTHKATGREVPFRVEYVIDKCDATKALLGHPFILRSMEKLQGPGFLPTWDSMVFKMVGAGAIIPWHRDGGADILDIYSRHTQYAINVDFYLDGSDLSNCLWGIPGTNLLSAADANALVKKMNQGEFSTQGAVPLPVRPGDVLFHSILVLHGSPAAQSQLRRVIYYEFRPIDAEREHGPHTPEYIPIKQRAMRACIEHRKQTSYGQTEKPYEYRGDLDGPGRGEALQLPLPTYRYPHEEHRRNR